MEHYWKMTIGFKLYSRNETVTVAYFISSSIRYTNGIQLSAFGFFIDITYLSSMEIGQKNGKWSHEYIVKLGRHILQTIMSIPIGTNCAPRLVDFSFTPMLYQGHDENLVIWELTAMSVNTVHVIHSYDEHVQN
jgi:hypothetical protein